MAIKKVIEKDRGEFNKFFFQNKWRVNPELEAIRLDLSRKYLGFVPNADTVEPPIFSLSEVLKKVVTDGKIVKPSFKFISPALKPEDIPFKWGFTPDKKIADLVITLNRMGLYTSSSCEGHSDHGEPFAQVSFWNEELYKVMGALAQWPEVDNSGLKIRFTPSITEEVKGKMFDVLFDTGDLERNQNIAQELTDYLKSKAIQRPPK